jgi:hypothetical protein
VNLTGFWSGSYWYFVPGEPVVPFLANIDHTSGVLTGSISEPDLHFGSGMRLKAILMGQLDGSSVSFAKAYDGAGPLAYRVDYDGVVSDDGRIIRGSWYLTGEQGGFEMSRELLQAEEEYEELAEARFS